VSDAIICSAETCRDLAAASSREWLETNGLGGYASSSVTGMNTRRYHGLLVAATRAPVGRAVLLSKLEETLVFGETRVDLSTNQFPGVLHPEGYRWLAEFRLDPFPTWVFEIEGLRLTKTLFMVHGESTTVVVYTLEAPAVSLPETLRLEVRPLIAFRDFHSLTQENTAIDRRVSLEVGLAHLTPYDGLPTLHVAHDGAVEAAGGDWYRSFEYERERERGFDFLEDLYKPFDITFDLSSRPTATVIASTGRHAAADAHGLRERELSRRTALPPLEASSDAVVGALRRAGDQFLVARRNLTTVIAGYHWFCDWGRDTMIALPGLTLAAGRPDVAKEILLAFARHVDQGMLPNRFPETGEEPEYNTVDATLWFFEAVRRTLEATGDAAFVANSLYSVLVDIVDWHERGTRYGIRVDEDGLLLSGEEGVQLTWMDAKVGDWVVTPRRGKPVEVQALWFNALKTMEGLAVRFGKDDDAARFARMAIRAAASFNRIFWNAGASCLYDVVLGDLRDASIRPNQILAASLPYSMLEASRARAVLDVVTRELLTPYGLRTLSALDPAYRGRYEGDGASRDGAYHQGTVWPWLIGPYVTAFLNVNGRSEKARKEAAALLVPLSDFLLGPGLGQLPEIFDGDAPHRPCGAIAQAWSVAEVLRLLVEELSEQAG
jgi:predicted glycogen debranching enzyme